MVTYASSYNSRRALPGDAYDGVVRVVAGGFYGSGVLLSGGRAVLTAAHLIGVNGTSASVEFDTTSGKQTIKASWVQVHPQYTSQGNHDLALLWLDASAPLAAQRSALYREADEVGKVFTLVGFGASGFGSTDHVDRQDFVRFKAENRFDALADTLKSSMGSAMDWMPLAGTQLVADFDNGNVANDALGYLMGVQNTGQGLLEGLIAPGDSGGPAFIDGNVAGLASYVASLSLPGKRPDVDSETNSSFGEVASWQRVSAFQQWIDQTIRARMADAPSKPEQVQKTVAEGNAGTKLVYFLLSLAGLGSDSERWSSVDFATRDGTALASQDYVAVSGTLVLYPGESQAVIPVEVVSDMVPEPNEYFFLDVFNPVGAGFEGSAVKLTAMRTITDDDGWWT